MHTVIYNDAWQPVHVMVGMWEGNVYHYPWVPYHLWCLAQPKADKLVADFYRQGKVGSHTFRLPRWHQDIYQAIALYLRSTGFQVEVVCPPYQTDHCRQFTLTRR